MDLRSHYDQLKTKASDSPKAVFGTRYGNNEFLMMFFSLTNATAMFMEFMHIMF